MTPAGKTGAAAAAVVAAAALSWWAFAPPKIGTSADAGVATSAGAEASGATLLGAPMPMGAGPVAGPASLASEPEPPAAVPLGSNEVPDLRADAAGRLVIDAHTRDELEKLLALNGRIEAEALLQRLEAVLPPVAYRQAIDAAHVYQNYSIAAAQLTSPAQPVTDEAGALQQLDALHALRVQQFGPEVAQAYFGEEEATARRLIAEMRARPASGSTLTERAEQAQRTLNPGR